MMEWIVKNANSRDVERQHLNKILKDIRATLDSLKGTVLTGNDFERKVVTTITKVVSTPGAGSAGAGLSPAIKDFTITLSGNASGSGLVKGLNNVTIPVTVDPSILGIQDAPIGNIPYWRMAGQWYPVDLIISTLPLMEGEGYTHYTEEEGWTGKSAQEVSADVHVVELEAATTIHGRRAVMAELDEAYHPSLAVASDGPKVIGIAKNSATAGDVVVVQTGGLITEGSWAWAPGPVFCDDEGVLTQTAPLTGWVVCVGKAVASDTIDINVLLTLIRS